MAGEPEPVQHSQPSIDGAGEKLTDSDRRALDQVVRQRSGR